VSVGGSGGGGNDATSDAVVDAADASQERCTTADCLPAELVTGEDVPLHVAVDDANVYWVNLASYTDAADGSVRKASKDGGPIATLAAGLPSPWAIALDETLVYFNASGLILSIPTTGGIPSVLFIGTDGVLGLALDSGYVYWGETSSGGVRRVSKAGGTFETVTPPSASADSVRAIATTDTFVYSHRSGNSGAAIFRAPVGGGPEEKIADAIRTVQAIAVSEPYVFAAGDGVVRYSIDGATPVVVTDAWSFDVTVDGEFAYWTEQSDGYVRRARLGSVDSTALASGRVQPLGIAVDGTHVYWTESESRAHAGKIMKVAK
jgi:hypothetical protein